LATNNLFPAVAAATEEEPDTMLVADATEASSSSSCVAVVVAAADAAAAAAATTPAIVAVLADGRGSAAMLIRLGVVCACAGAGVVPLAARVAARFNKATMPSKRRSIARDNGVHFFSFHAPCHVDGSAVSSKGTESTMG